MLMKCEFVDVKYIGFLWSGGVSFWI